jgi:CheY-like chemotaxis protein
MAKILVVEDSPDIRTLIGMLLETAGHRVEAAADGRAAVDLARQTRPDLILMDLSLPVLSGWEAARQIKAQPATASIPILAVTAHAMQGDRERALAAGCDGFIPKPIDEETFLAQIEEHLGSASSGPAAEPVRETDRRRQPDLTPARILVVDDQPEVVDLIRADLENDGHEIVVADSFQEAVEIFAREKPFELAVIDVMLGPESGYDLTSQLIALSAEYFPVLLITAGTLDREKAFQVGADDFIGKPIESAELRARVRSLVRVGRAIREQGRAIKERSEAYEKLVELDRLKSDFLSTVSHELRTPLNTIILLAHLIAREGKTPADEERRIHDARVIRESAETLLRMINNILDLAKLEAGQRDLHPQRFHLRKFLQEMADLLEPQARPKTLELQLEADANLPETVVLDREKVSRVLLNLLSNAVKFTQQGRVVLRASPWRQGSICFEVEDTGVGIPPHLIAVAFEPFRQIRPYVGDTPRGSGLGLTISKQLVEMMGGDLLVDSRENVGTRMTFTLPQLVEAQEVAGSMEAANREAGRGGKTSRLLVVEDDAASRYGLKSLLESEGYEVTEAATLAEIVEVTRLETPAAVVLDITLPDGDGAEWVRLMQKRKGTLPFPVIALTGVTADEDRRRIEQSGVHAVLHKPVNVNLLLQALEECLVPGERSAEIPAPAADASANGPSDVRR